MHKTTVCSPLIGHKCKCLVTPDWGAMNNASVGPAFSGFTRTAARTPSAACGGRKRRGESDAAIQRVDTTTSARGD